MKVVMIYKDEICGVVTIINAYGLSSAVMANLNKNKLPSDINLRSTTLLFHKECQSA